MFVAPMYMAAKSNKHVWLKKKNFYKTYRHFSKCWLHLTTYATFELQIPISDYILFVISHTQHLIIVMHTTNLIRSAGDTVNSKDRANIPHTNISRASNHEWNYHQFNVNQLTNYHIKCIIRTLTEQRSIILYMFVSTIKRRALKA